MARGFGKKQAKALVKKKAKKRKKNNAGHFGQRSSGTSSESVTSDKNRSCVPASGKREHNEKSHKENVATPSSEFGRVPKKRKISPSVDLATPVGIATSRRLPMRSLNENEQSTVASQHQVQMRSLDRKEEAVV